MYGHRSRIRRTWYSVALDVVVLIAVVDLSLLFSSLPSPFDFDLDMVRFHPVFFLWVLCCLLGSVSAPTRLGHTWYQVWYIYKICILIRTLISPSYFLSEVYDLFQLLCVLSSAFICFPPEVQYSMIFRSRVIGAGLVTTDSFVAMWPRTAL